MAGRASCPTVVWIVCVDRTRVPAGVLRWGPGHTLAAPQSRRAPLSPRPTLAVRPARCASRPAAGWRGTAVNRAPDFRCTCHRFRHALRLRHLHQRRRLPWLGWTASSPSRLDHFLHASPRRRMEGGAGLNGAWLAAVHAYAVLQAVAEYTAITVAAYTSSVKLDGVSSSSARASAAFTARRLHPPSPSLPSPAAANTMPKHLHGAHGSAGYLFAAPSPAMLASAPLSLHASPPPPLTVQPTITGLTLGSAPLLLKSNVAAVPRIQYRLRCVGRPHSRYPSCHPSSVMPSMYNNGLNAFISIPLCIL